MGEERYEDILTYWFGHVEDTIVPSKQRARIWFGNDDEIDQEIREKFSLDYTHAITGHFHECLDHPRGQLALILMFDQFSRHLHRGTKDAFSHDQQAISVCITGIQKEFDHKLSLIERVFYYFPLLHAEDLSLQQQSVFVYKSLLDLALPETRGVYESFLEFSAHHYEVIKRYGRFPQRNRWLGRESTTEEVIYLKEYQDQE